MPIDIRTHVPGIEDIWAETRGAGVVVAVIDEEVDVRGHPEFLGRTLPGYNDSSSDYWSGADVLRPHGTKVAGLALAAGVEISGVAPDALLLPVGVPVLGTRTGDPAEADAIRWAADRGADVICCAWAPPAGVEDDGRLPAHTRDALDYAVAHGRNGTGCIVVFAAGNDGRDIARNGYASHPGVIAVGACNCLGTRPKYSSWGDALWCVFPSNDPDDAVGAGMTYLTTTPAGSFLAGQTFYTSSFGFTSAACSAVAGICALILSANPDLTWRQVKQVIRLSCEKIDKENATYDADGHSVLHGYGRPDIGRAIRFARQHTKPPGASV
jgi:subtilisin family serine protease